MAQSIRQRLSAAIYAAQDGDREVRQFHLGRPTLDAALDDPELHGHLIPSDRIGVYRFGAYDVVETEGSDQVIYSDDERAPFV